MRSILAGLAVAAVLLTPSEASAVRTWQPAQTLSQSIHPTPVDTRGFVMDGSGNSLFGVSDGHPGYRFMTREHAGALGSPQAFPTGTTLGQNPAVFAMDGSGNAITWDGFWSAYRPAGGTFGNGQVTNTPVPWRLIDVAMAPTGEAFGLFATSDAILVAFRLAGAASTFDIAGGTQLPPAAGDDRVTGVGVAIDPDGGAVALYRSFKSSGGSTVLLQSVRPAGGTWDTPAAVAGYPNSAGAVFDKADDGTAVVATSNAGNTVMLASIRAAGGGFETTQTLPSQISGEVGVQPKVAAARGGAVVAWNQGTPSGCGGGVGLGDAGWQAASYYSGTWHSAAAGPHAYPTVSTLVGLDGSGPALGVLALETTGLGDRCASTGTTASLRAYVGTLANLTTNSTAVEPVDSGDPNHPTTAQGSFIGVGSGGDALVGYDYTGNYNTDYASHLLAFEDPATTPGGGSSPPPGGGYPGSIPGPGGGSGNPPGGGSGGPITAPAKVILHGPLVVRSGLTPIAFHCNSPSECLMVVQLLGVKKASRVSTAAAKPKALATGKGRIKAGKTGKIKVRLTSAAKRSLKKAKKRRMKVRIKVTVTTRGKKTTLPETTATLQG
jgi:hypothetical protein